MVLGVLNVAALRDMQAFPEHINADDLWLFLNASSRK